jgi:hypothetical protein
MNRHSHYRMLGWAVSVLATTAVALGAASIAISNLDYGWA